MDFQNNKVILIVTSIVIFFLMYNFYLKNERDSDVQKEMLDKLDDLKEFNQYMRIINELKEYNKELSLQYQEMKKYATKGNMMTANLELEREKLYLIQQKSELFDLDANKKIIFPPKIKKVYIEVGIHKKSKLETHIMKTEDAFLIGFEPVHEYYKESLKLDKDKFRVIQAALAEEDGYKTFYVESVGGERSSLSKPNGKYIRSVDSFEAATIKLQTILELIDTDKYSLEYLKVDAQGHDYRVLKSAGDLLKKVKSVTLKCQDISKGDDKQLYEDIHYCPDVKDYMKKMEFVESNCVLISPVFNEYHCHYGKTKEDSTFASDIYQ
eukprot:TRINITY_DN10992_c0_g1_i1.p1 TRINITY_DN10992_c0_g1~~TRINITY_DN10992_c0_g1_i1.p1  ORF type:complete len:325 (-),score=72.00 TRINITY_DN10992_c0_g1_i1:65-1039(-)